MNNNDIPYYKSQNNEIELFEHAYNNQLPLLIKGPTGCGKTRFIQHMAAKLGRPLYTVACHDDLTAADLVGRHLIGDGATYWHDAPLSKAVREGAICYLDEVVEARKDTTVVLHPLSDDRRILPIERTGEVLHASPEFMLVVSYNPGYQNMLKGMKPSTRQRFISMRFDYPDMDTETTIIQQETEIDKATASQLIELAQALRVLKDKDIEKDTSNRPCYGPPLAPGRQVHSRSRPYERNDLQLMLRRIRGTGNRCGGSFLACPLQTEMAVEDRLSFAQSALCRV